MVARFNVRPHAERATPDPPRLDVSTFCDIVHGSETEASNDSFAGYLRDVRTRLDLKRIAFCFAIGCTEAAISLWESGARLPTPKNLSRILAAVAQGGGSTTQILVLRGLWRGERMRRSDRRVGSVDQSSMDSTSALAPNA